MSQKVLAITIILIILGILAPAKYYSFTKKPSEFTVAIDLDSLGDRNVVVSWAVLSIPGERSLNPKIDMGKGRLVLRFEVPEESWRKVVMNAGIPPATPTITILLSDYDNNKSYTIIIPSAYIISHNEHIIDPAKINRILREDPAAALSFRGIVLDKNTIQDMEKQGYIIEVNKTLSDKAPLRFWEEPQARPDCTRWVLVSSGDRIYYEKNTRHAAAKEELPAWWYNHFIHEKGRGAYYYWEAFRDRLVAAYYYVPASESMNKALQDIARWAFNPDHSNKGEGGLIPVNAVPLEDFVGGDHWNNTLPPLAYMGLIPLFQVATENSVGTPNSRDTLAVSTAYFAAQYPGSISGLLIDGMYASAQSTANIAMRTGSFILSLTGQSRYIYVEGRIYSPGDYIVTIWKPAGSVTCNGTVYRVIIPRTMIVSFYTLSLDYNRIYVLKTRLEGPAPLASPGASVLLGSYKYWQGDYEGNLKQIFQFEINRLNVNATMGYEATLGGPAYTLAQAIFRGAKNGVFEYLSRDLASRLLDTGLVAGINAGGKIILTISLLQNDKPNETYTVTFTNLVPSSLDGKEGLGSLSWGGVVVSISKPSGG